MIPPFDEHGYLPPGIHLATLDEIEARFGRESELRRVQMESVGSEGHDRGNSMSLLNEQELSVTREKLRMLEESYTAARQDTSGSRHAQELELRSLKQLINQLREEIARFEAREAAPARNG